MSTLFNNCQLPQVVFFYFFFKYFANAILFKVFTSNAIFALIFWTPSSASTAFKCIFETFLDIKGYWVLRLYDYLDQNWSMVIKMAWSIEIRLPRQLLQQNCYGTFFGPSCSGATKIENNKLQVNRNHCRVCERTFGGTISRLSFCSLSFHRDHLDYCVVFLWYFCICVSFFIYITFSNIHWRMLQVWCILR